MKNKYGKFDISEEWLREQYLVLGKPISTIGKEIGCSETTARNHLISFGIPLRPSKIDLPPDELRELYATGINKTELGRHFNCSASHITKQLVKHKIIFPDMNKKPRTNLAGKVIGLLTIESYHGRDEMGRHLWNCSCECGNTIIAIADYLVTRERASCGCISRGSFQRILNGEGFVCDMLYTKLKAPEMLNRSRNRTLKFDLTIEQLESLPHSECIYCGDALIFPKCANDFKKHLYNASLDRIDSEIDYIPENVRWICKICNYMKLDYTEKEFLEHLNKFAKKRDKDKAIEIADKIKRLQLM